jgi:hypothetical protein
MDYQEIAAARIAQFEAELYDNQVMLRISERTGIEADIAQFQANINTIQIAIEEWRKELG